MTDVRNARTSVRVAVRPIIDVRNARTSVRVAIGPGVFVQAWTGSAFAPAPLKVWDGTGFVGAAAVKTWNGSAFL